MSDSQNFAGLAALNAQLSRGVNSGFLSVAQKIADVGARFPESPAVESGGCQITFSSLLARVARASALFREAGAAAPVVVCTDDPLLMIVCAMAAWSVGQCYLPVSPSGPIERLRHILNEARPSLIATTKECLDVLPPGDWQTLAVGELASPGFAAAETASGLFASIQPGSCAYIIYTSGSTGQPKGVCVSQANLAHLVDWYSSAFHPSPQSRASHLSALTFDAAVLEIWTNLSTGATLCVPDRSVTLNPERLRDYLVDEEVTRCFATTAIAERLLALDWPKTAKLEFLLTGADTLRVFPPSTLPFHLVNNYGPTECTVLATSGIVPPDSGGRLLPTIGRPIPGATVYIADAYLNEVPDGQRGEICIGGAGVAAGYIGSPGLTSERFVPDHFCGRPARMYRTGDIGRKLPDGELEFLGRLDQQIKLRGYRVEPGEIVGALRLHSAVRGAAVMPIGSDSHRQIAAYVTLKEAVTPQQLREHLSSRVPEYMIPDRFVRLEEFPFTPNGKVDLLALPLPDSSNVLAEEELVMGPATEIQEEVRSILSSLLGGRSVALHDNFFRLGGHSLLAAQVIARVRTAFGVDLALRTVFESPTAAGLSEAIGDKILAAVAALSPDEFTSGASA